MDIEEQVWQLTTKKLANEASADELRELDELLMENPQLKTSLILIFDWWKDGKQDTQTNSALLFERILKNITPANATVQGNVRIAPPFLPMYTTNRKLIKRNISHWSFRFAVISHWLPDALMNDNAPMN